MSLRVGETKPNVNIKPVKGRFFTLSGTLIPIPDRTATLTLITDTGRKEIASAYSKPLPFSTAGVQPGPVELIVKGFDTLGNECGSYTKLLVDKDKDNLKLACSPYGPASFTFSGATPTGPVVIRRVDLDGAAEEHALKRNELLAPGHWEIQIPPGDYYISSVRNSGTLATRAGAWWGFDAGTYTRVAILLSSSPASIAGVVTTGGNPVAGAPIFLTNLGTGQAWTGRANPQGHYSMGGLAPGNYSIISGFDLDPNDLANAQKLSTVSTSEGNTSTQPLELVLP